MQIKLKSLIKYKHCVLFLYIVTRNEAINKTTVFFYKNYYNLNYFLRYPKGRGVTSKTGELWVEGIIVCSMNTMKATSRTNTRRATQSPVFNHSFLFLVSILVLRIYLKKSEPIIVVDRIVKYFKIFNFLNLIILIWPFPLSNVLLTKFVYFC